MSFMVITFDVVYVTQIRSCHVQHGILKFDKITYKQQLIPTSKRINDVSMMKTNECTIFRKKIAVCCEKHIVWARCRICKRYRKWHMWVLLGLKRSKARDVISQTTILILLVYSGS